MIQKQVPNTKRRICYINTDSRTLETSVSFLEKRLFLISNVDISQHSSLEIAKSKGAWDLFIINASNLEEDHFIQWFSKLGQKLLNPLGIPSPCMLISPLSFNHLESMWEKAYKQNWYFDILHPEHMESLPIRIANLLRIQDHLHELQRYEKELTALHERITKIEKLKKEKS